MDDEDIRRIRAAIADLAVRNRTDGKSQKGLAQALNMAPSGVNRIGKGQRDIKAQEMPVIKRYLEDAASPPTARSDVDFSRRVPVPDGPRDLPIYGFVKGGPIGDVVDMAEESEMRPRPPSLIGVNRAFGLVVIGDSMEPKFSRGHIVYVHPGRPITRGCSVAVLLTDGSAILKQFIRKGADAYELEQLNPPAKLKVSLEQIDKIYRIVGSEEP